MLIAWRENRPVGYAAFRLWVGDWDAAGVLAEIFSSRGDAEGWGALLRASLRCLYAAGENQAVALAVPEGEEWNALRGLGSSLARLSAFRPCHSETPYRWRSCVNRTTGVWLVATSM